MRIGWGAVPPAVPPPPTVTAVGASTLTMVMAPRLATILLVLALAGCGAPPGSPSPSASPSVSAVQVTDADAGRTVSLAVGERLDVSLHQATGFLVWQQPVSSDPSVLQPLQSGGGSSSAGMTRASFMALRAGRADLTSAAPFACSPGAYCPAIAQTWRVTVSVG